MRRALPWALARGDGQPGLEQSLKPNITANKVEITIEGKTFVFLKQQPFAIRMQ